jgi:hypothetical protein
MKQLTELIGSIVFVVLVLLIFSFLLSWPVMALWNGCLVDAVSDVNEITWLQAWGISILCGLLFKSNISNSK